MASIKVFTFTIFIQAIFAIPTPDLNAAPAGELEVEDIYNYAPDFGQDYASEIMRVERDDGNNQYEFDVAYTTDGTRIERDFKINAKDGAIVETDFKMDAKDGGRILKDYKMAAEDGARIVRDYQGDAEDGARTVRDFQVDVEDGARIERDFKFDFPADIMQDSEIDLAEFNRKDVEIISHNDGQPIVIFAGNNEPGIKHHDPIERTDLPCDAKEKIIKGKPHAIVHRQSPILFRRPPTYVKIEHEPILFKPNPVVFYQHPSTVKQPIIHKHLPQKVHYHPYIVKVEKPMEKKILLEKNKIEKPCHHHHHEMIDKHDVPNGYQVKEIFPQDLEAELKMHN